MRTALLLAAALATATAASSARLKAQEGSAADLRAKALSIHTAALTLDTHKDISDKLASVRYEGSPEEVERLRQKNDPTVRGTSQVDFPKMREGGLDAAFYIVYVGQGELNEDGYALARKQADAKFDAIHRMADRYPDDIGLATSASDVRRLGKEGKLIACIGIENGYPMGTDIGAIAEFHRRGARYMGLVHNRHSQLADSHTPADEPLHGGLSDLGREAIAEMNRVGIMVDISHASKASTLQALAHSKAPVMASHSGADGVFDHGRNLSDEELMALKKNGGVLQCVAFDSYVKSDGGRRDFIKETREQLGLPPARGIQPAESDPDAQKKMLELRERVRAFDAKVEKASVKHFVNHIDYAVEKIGIDHVGISSDFDGGGGVEGWNDASETLNVTLELVRRGYDAESINKIWSGNTLRVWEEVEAAAKRLQDAK